MSNETTRLGNNSTRIADALDLIESLQAGWNKEITTSALLEVKNEELQVELDRLKYPDNCAIEIDGKGYYIEPAAYRKIKSLQADLEDLKGMYRVACESQTRTHTENLKLRAEVEVLKRYECSWTDCGEKKKNKELQAEVEYWKEQAEMGANNGERR